MQRTYFATSLFLSALLVTPAVAKAADWIQLDGTPTMEAWQGDGREWMLAADVVLDEGNPKNLIAKPEGNILVSLSHEQSDLSNLTSQRHFGDVEVHVEFMIPKGSNAGVKLQGLYEIQIRDTHGKTKPEANDCGGIYPRAEEKPRYHLIDEGVPPLSNAAKPAGQWQAMDIVFHAPRFDSEGEKKKNARFIKVVLNGKLIHENVELKWPTGHAWREKPEVAVGPLYLQGDHGPVAYRNIRVRPITQGEAQSN